MINNHSRKLGVTDNTHQSNSNEWFTPSVYIDLAREVMGEIDLDPASNQQANNTVKAGKYFDREMDGLNQDWFGRVFLNPPYGKVNGRSGAGIWIEKAIHEYQSGNVSEVIVLVNSSTGDKWFQPLFNYPICFVNRRIKFYQSNGNKVQPTKSNVMIYIGSNNEIFTELFGEIGHIYIPIKRTVNFISGDRKQ